MSKKSNSMQFWTQYGHFQKKIVLRRKVTQNQKWMKGKVTLLVQINIMKWFVALDNIPVSVNCFCLITDRIDHILIHPKRNIHQFRSPFFNLRRRLNWPNARVSRFNLFWCQCWFNNFFNFFWCQFGRRPSPSCSDWRWFRANWCWQSGTGR